MRTGAATVVQAVAEGRRAAYAMDAYLKGMDLEAIRTRQTLAEPQPEFLSIVPYTERGQGAPHSASRRCPRRCATRATSSTSSPYTQQEAMAESARCLQCTCEAIGYCDLRRQGIEYGTTLRTLEPARTGTSFRSVSENRFTGTNHDYIRDDSHAFILREPSRCIDCGRCANVCKEVVGAACYDFMRTGLRHARDHAPGHEPQHDALRVVRTLRGDLPHGRPDAQAAGAREVRGRREPLHPVRHLRRRLPLRRAALRPRLRALPTTAARSR